MDDFEIITRDMIIEFRKSVPEKQSAIWTKDEKEKVVTMYEEGYTIAMSLGHNESATQKQLDNLGVCNASKRYRGENKVKCRCEECDLYKLGMCDGGKYCKITIPRRSRGYFNNRPIGAHVTSHALKGVLPQDASRLRSLASCYCLPVNGSVSSNVS